MQEKTLAGAKPGATVTLKRMSNAIEGAERRRLYDLGFVQGTSIQVAYRSPSGDPTAYYVRGTLIALRASQARHLYVEQS